MTRWSGSSPRYTPEQYRRAMQVRAERQRARQQLLEARRLRDSLPTDEDLAREFGTTPIAVANLMSRGIKRYDIQAQRANQEDQR